jgi:hypothetical protein
MSASGIICLQFLDFVTIWKLCGQPQVPAASTLGKELSVPFGEETEWAAESEMTI